MNPDFSVYLLILAAGVAPNAIWRVFGVLFAARIDDTSPVFQWVNAVATALIAALVARMILLPPGVLAETALTSRIGGIVAAILVYNLSRRNLGLSVATAVTVLLIAEQF